MIYVTVVLVGLVGTSLTFLHNSIMFFWILGSDITYTIMFPQLVCVLFFKISNCYGSVMGLVVGVLLRVLCGEPAIGLPVVLCLPGCTLEDGAYVQRAPVVTICMLSTFSATLLFSYLASLLFKKELIPENWHVLKGNSPRAVQQCTTTSHDTTKQDEQEKPEETELKLLTNQ